MTAAAQLHRRRVARFMQPLYKPWLSISSWYLAWVIGSKSTTLSPSMAGSLSDSKTMLCCTVSAGEPRSREAPHPTLKGSPFLKRVRHLKWLQPRSRGLLLSPRRRLDARRIWLDWRATLGVRATVFAGGRSPQASSLDAPASEESSRRCRPH